MAELIPDAKFVEAEVLITFITALLLGFVNQVTAPKIAENNE